MKKAVFTFGRFSPPTVGHTKLIDKTVNHAKETGADHYIYTSKSHDNSKNPIPYDKKVGFLRKLHPHANIEDHPDAHTAFHIAKILSDKGYEHVTMVVGQDRVNEFKNSIGKYVKHKSEPGYDPKKHYNFKHFNVVSAGDRDPNATGVEGMSGTKMRDAVRKGNFKDFARGITGNNVKVKRDIFNTVKKNLKEDEDHKFQGQLDTFVKFASDHLGIKSFPGIKIVNPEDSVDSKSFGGYNPETQQITVRTKDRHPMDIFRTVAHELVHHKQNLAGKINDVAKEGSTGSKIENEANFKAGIIMRRYADAYPDTFANPSIMYEDNLEEGIHDPAIFKAIFLAGGPGSGKDYVMRQTMDGLGLTEINSDIALEFLMRKEGLNMKMPENERMKRDLVRGRAKLISKEKQRLALSGRLGLIINGTADDYAHIEGIKKQLESMGYETFMVFVNTSNETSQARNVARGDRGGRTVPEIIRSEKWQLAQQNIGHFQKLFGLARFVVLDNSTNVHEEQSYVNSFKAELLRIHKMIRAFVNMPVNNPNASHWIALQKEKRQLYEYWLEGTPEIVANYKKVTPGQHGKDDQTPQSKIKKYKYLEVKKLKDMLPQSVKIQEWALKESTQERFIERYGPLAEDKLIQTANKLFTAFGADIQPGSKKTLSEIRTHGSDDPNADEIMTN